MLGLSIKLSPTQSSTTSSHFPTASACAQRQLYGSECCSQEDYVSICLSLPPPELYLQKGNFDCQYFWASSAFGFLELRLSSPASFIKNANATISAWISERCSKQRLGGNMRAQIPWSQAEAFHPVVPPLTLPAQKAGNIQQGREKRLPFFFF